MKLSTDRSRHPGEEIDDVLRRLAPSVHRWVAALIGRGPDLDDAVQEALIEVAASLPRFQGRAKLTTYAHRIVVRTTLRHVRRRPRNETALEMAPAPADTMDPERCAMSQQATRRLYRALDTLTVKRRGAFVLCAIEQMPHEEAAVVADCSVETLRARLKHARRDLHQRLRDDPYLAPLFGEGSR